MIYILQYSALDNWSCWGATKKKCFDESKHDAFLLSELLERVKEPVKIQDNQKYTRLTIKAGGSGVVVRMKGGRREEILGKEIGRKNQFRVHRGQLVVSSIDARNGAVGIVPEDADGSVVTDNFWVFEINKNKVRPAFLQHLLASPIVTSQIRDISHGTTNRQYITIDQFLRVSVVLPDDATQKKFLEQYKRLQDKKLKLQAEIDSFGGRRDAAISRILGASSTPRKSRDGKLLIIEYKDMYRWSVGGPSNFTSTQSAVLRMKECIEEFMVRDGKSLRINPQKTPMREFCYIGMDGVRKDVGLLVDEPRIARGADIKSAAIEVPRGYVIYGKLRPYLNKFWANDTDNDEIVCSSEFLVFRPASRIDFNYFMAILGSDYIQRQIVDKLAGTRMPRLSTTDFLDLELPGPSMATQIEVGREFHKLQKDVEKEQEKLRRQTSAQTEKLFTRYGLKSK